MNIHVGDSFLGYDVIATDGDFVTIKAPSNITFSFSVSGIQGGLKAVLCMIGIAGACD